MYTMLMFRMILFVSLQSIWLGLIMPPSEETFLTLTLSCVIQSFVFFLIFNKDRYTDKKVSNFLLVGIFCTLLGHCLGWTLYYYCQKGLS